MKWLVEKKTDGYFMKHFSCETELQYFEVHYNQLSTIDICYHLTAKSTTVMLVIIFLTDYVTDTYEKF